MQCCVPCFTLFEGCVDELRLGEKRFFSPELICIGAYKILMLYLQEKISLPF